MKCFVVNMKLFIIIPLLLSCHLPLFLVAEERQTLLDSAEHEGTKFQSALDDVLQWIEAMNRRLASLDPVSGDKERLRQQVMANEVSYGKKALHKCYIVPY